MKPNQKMKAFQFFSFLPVILNAINGYTYLRGLLLVLAPKKNLVSLALSLPRGGSGGRAASTADRLTGASSTSSLWQPFLKPLPSEAKLTVVHVTDIYTLANFASIKTLLAEMRQKMCDNQYSANKVISILTGDFLAPYLLSSIDQGAGMMNAIAKTPIDFLTWGNHEADIDHRAVCEHVKSFPGIWLNTNMQDHEAMKYQEPFHVVEVSSPDGSNKRRIGLVAVLSHEKALYAQFKPPGAFGGATIKDPWDTLAEYKELLEGPEYNCDVVLPLQHMYVPDDHKTCELFDFPVVLSGHDHHRVDEIVRGTRLLKPGLDAVYATILDISWDDDLECTKPTINARFVKCDEWEPDPELDLENVKAYDALLPLRDTELARVPPTFEPLSSVNSRGKVTTMGRFICSLIRSSLNVSRRQRAHLVDAVILMGGNIRGGIDYSLGSFFSLEALEAEIKANEAIAVIEIPGWVLAEGIEATHAGDPIPGWMQYDSGIRQDSDGRVTHVADQPLERDRIYRVATKTGDLTNGQSEPLTVYFKAHPELFPAKGAYVNIHAELMSYFARNVWRKIWDGVGPNLKRKADFYVDNPETITEISQECLNKLDLDQDGIVSVDDIHIALSKIVGLSVHDSQKSLARFVHSFADINGDGQVALDDFETFCKQLPILYENDKWRLAFPRGDPVLKV